MTVERPELLWTVAAGVGVLAVAFILHTRRRRRIGAAFGGREPARRLTGLDPGRAPWVRYLLVTVAVAALTLAGSGLRRPDPPDVDPARPVDAVVALDYSRSMGSADVAPSRLGRAKALAARVLETLPGDRVGLVTFAHQAYALVPPTRDHRVVRYFLDAHRPGLLPDADEGTRISEALRASGDLLERYASPGARRLVILITDGETHDERGRVLGMSGALRAAGVRVVTVGVGTRAGVPLVRLDHRGGRAGLLRAAGGDPVVTRLNSGFLERLAEEGGGEYLDGAESTRHELASVLIGGPGERGPERRGGEAGDGHADLPYRLGVLGLLLLVAEGAGEAVGRRREPRRRGEDR